MVSAHPDPSRAPIGPRGHRAAAVVQFRRHSPIELFLVALLLLYVIKQIIMVLVFVPFSGHDEVAHYSYIRTLATEGRIPVLPELAEWQAAVDGGERPVFDELPDELYPYCRYTLSWHCQPHVGKWLNSPPRMETMLRVLYPTGFQYVANHPPLYYVLMTPIYWLSAGYSAEVQQYLLRLAAIPFGLLTVFLSYRLVRTLFPGDAFLAVTVPTFVAFQPQISYEAAMVNNDMLAIALYTLLLYLSVAGIRHRFPVRACLWLGVVLGLAVVTKSTSLTAVPVIALAIVLAMGWRHVWQWVGKGALVAAPAAIIAAPWYFFMFRTYGNFDAMDQLARLQYWNYFRREAPGFFDLLFNPNFVTMRFRETWGEFGWRRLPLDTELLWVIAVPTLVCLAGLVAYLWQAGRRTRTTNDAVMRPERWQWHALLVLGFTCVIAYLAVVQFGTRFELTQARYFFPAVSAAAVLLLLGLRTLIPSSVHRYAQGVFFAGMVVLNLLIFVQYVLPYFRQA